MLFGYVVERSITYENFEVNLVEDNKIIVTDLIQEMREELDFKERVINLSMAYGHLLVNTHSHCYIYSFTVIKILNSFSFLICVVIKELEHSADIRHQGSS